MPSSPRRSILAVCALCASACAPPGASTPTPAPGGATITAVRFGTLVTGDGPVLRDAVVVISADTVLRVGTGDRAVPAGATVMDLRRYTGIPGLIDVHTHVTYWRDKVNDPLGRRGPRLRDSVILAASENLRKTLETGVTTVRDLGASRYIDIALRDSVNKGAFVGPRMFVAGYGMSNAGQGRGGNPPQRNPAVGRIVDSLDIPAAVKTQVDSGVDWIKMYGSTGTYNNVTGRQTFTDREMQIAVREAHRWGKPIAIHSYGDSGGRAAMRAGAESVEHPAGLDDASLAEFARRGTFYVPTVDHNRFYAENASLLGYDAQSVAALDSFIVLNLETVRRAHQAHVKIAMGSDAVFWMFGENTRELGWFVKAGMTPAEALATATTNAAELLRRPKKLGRVGPGSYADIVAIEGDPLAHIGAVITGVRWVMKGGAVVVDRRSP